jgi:hypothetical protein
MSDNDKKNLPVPSGGNLPAKKTGTDIVPRKGTEVKAKSTAVGHPHNTDAAAVDAFRAQGGAVGPAINKPSSSRGTPKRENSNKDTAQPANGKAKKGFLAVAALGGLAVGATLVSMMGTPNDSESTNNLPDGVIRFDGPYTHCVNASELSLHTGPSTSYDAVTTMGRGLKIAVGGELNSGWNELTLEGDFGKNQTVYMLGGQYVVDLSVFPTSACRPNQP